MSAGLYDIAEKEAKEMAEMLKITDSWKIREMTLENLKKLMVEKGAELVESLNIMGNDVGDAVVDGLFTGIINSHRYLQGEFWPVMVKVLKLIGKYGDTNSFDGRNQFAVEMCKRMAIAGEDPRTMEVLQKHIEDTKY